jgi:2-dehydropantoate 2-reductase
VVHVSCSLDEPGQVHHHFGNKLIIGEPSGDKTARVQQLAALLEKAGFEAQVSDQIQKDIWFKLWGNMTANPISALTGATMDRVHGRRAGDAPLLTASCSKPRKSARASASP